MKIQNLPSQQLRTLKTPGERPQPPAEGPQDTFQPSPVSKPEPKFLPRVMRTVAAVGAAAIGFYAAASGSMLASVATGALAGAAVLGAAGMMADVANMMSGSAKNTATGVVLGAVVGATAGAALAACASPAAGVALGLVAAVPAGFLGSLAGKLLARRG